MKYILLIQLSRFGMIEKIEIADMKTLKDNMIKDKALLVPFHEITEALRKIIMFALNTEHQYWTVTVQ